MKQEASIVLEKSEVMTTLAEESSTSVEKFNGTMHELNTDASHMANVVENIENLAFIVLTKIDHIIYKANTYNMLVDARIDSRSPSETACNFGKWYTSAGKERFGMTNSYRAIATPHKKVHDLITNSITYISNNTRLENEHKIIENLKAMESASFELFKLLDTMQEEKLK